MVPSAKNCMSASTDREKYHSDKQIWKLKGSKVIQRPNLSAACCRVGIQMSWYAQGTTRNFTMSAGLHKLRTWQTSAHMSTQLGHSRFNVECMPSTTSDYRILTSESERDCSRDLNYFYTHTCSTTAQCSYPQCSRIFICKGYWKAILTPCSRVTEGEWFRVRRPIEKFPAFLPRAYVLKSVFTGMVDVHVLRCVIRVYLLFLEMPIPYRLASFRSSYRSVHCLLSVFQTF